MADMYGGSYGGGYEHNGYETPYTKASPYGKAQPYDKVPKEVEVQEKLKILGYYPGGISGVYDAATKDAVKEFQYENGLSITGSVDERTMAQLYAKADAAVDEMPMSEMTKAKPTLHKGDKGASVAELQVELNQLGYNAGAVDGIYGPKTEAAVKKFQADNGLVVDAVVGPKTWSVLDYLYAPIGCTSHVEHVEQPSEQAEYKALPTYREYQGYQPQPEYREHPHKPEHHEHPHKPEYHEHSHKPEYREHPHKHEQKYHTYIVVSGDSLWSICRKNGIAAEALRSLNGLMSDTLRIGQVLKIPQ